MKREILFRGKEIKTGKWIEGDLLRMGGHSFIFPDPAPKVFNQYEVDPETVGQFTGVKDKNGTRIFEGDVIECLDSFDDSIRHRVEFRPEKGYFALFLIKGGDPWAIKVGNPDVGYICQSHIDRWSKYIVGNIYDNPDLLKTK